MPDAGRTVRAYHVCAAVLRLIDELNPDRKVTLNTVCFIYSMGEPQLMEIARRNKGTYKFVGEDDLQKILEESRPKK